ncbi:hypothetical protein GGF37_004687 [Kickxella alabastrina]|nr:hypothetical protein GGF37_004687 [Kickxella alabastrina]
MNRTLLNAFLAALVLAWVSSASPLQEQFAISELSLATSVGNRFVENTAPTAVIRNEFEETAAPPPASVTVTLPPPLTVAYQDQCNPCCANCVTYSDLHIDTDGDECCKPAAVIKTRHFVKEINYKCCTGPCGEVCCEPCCTKIVCNPCGHGDCITVGPCGARYCRECCDLCCHHHQPCCCHREPCCCESRCCKKCVVTHAIADNCGTHYCVSSCIKEPCGNRCVETHRCYAPNTCPHPCKENLSTEYCITHYIVEPPCGCCSCGCGCPCCMCSDRFCNGCKSCCPSPECTPMFQGSQAPQMPAAPSAAPKCPVVYDTASYCPRCPCCHACVESKPSN